MTKNPRILKVLLATGAGSFAFSDFYFPGVGRLFDYVFLAVIVFSLPFVHLGRNRNHQLAFLTAFWVLLPWLVMGAISGSLLMIFALCTGILLVSLVFGNHALEYREDFDRYLKAAIILCLAFFFVQYILQYSIGYYLDIHKAVGSITSRGWNEDLLYFRGSGIFQEPNAHCTVLFCLITIRRLTFGRKDWTFPVSLLSMVLSLSLWGFGATLLLIFLFYPPKVSVSIIGGLVLLALGFLAFSGVSMDSLVEDSVTLHRITNIDDDPSKQGRLGSSENYLNYDHFVLGSGFSRDQFQTIAANSYGFIFYALGLAGIGIVALIGVTYLGVRWKSIVLVLFLFTTFPQFSYLYFWVWFPLILAPPSRLEQGPQLSTL